MNAASEIDVRSLQEAARLSEEKESFAVLAKMKNCRIGAGARLASLAEPTFFIEVLVSLHASKDPVDLHRIERELALLRRLEQNGYVLRCEEDGCISCELTVQSKDLSTQFKSARSIINSFFRTAADS